MVREGRKDAQLVILVKPELAADLDTIRIITAASRARVIEPMLSEMAGHLLNGVHSTGLERVTALAEKAGVSTREYATAYAKAFQRYAEGPGLDALERDDTLVRAQLPRA